MNVSGLRRGKKTAQQHPNEPTYTGTLSHWPDTTAMGEKGFHASVSAEEGIYNRRLSLLIRTFALQEHEIPNLHVVLSLSLSPPEIFFYPGDFSSGEEEGTIYSFWQSRRRTKPPKVLDVVKMSISRGAPSCSQWLIRFSLSAVEKRQNQNFFERP